MKRLLYALIAAAVMTGAACAAIGFVFSATAPAKAQTANDLPTFLHYHPTDGDTQGGKVRRALDLRHI